MRQTSRWTLHKERIPLVIIIIISVITGFLLNNFGKTANNSFVSWLGVAVFCLAIILAVIVLPANMRKHEREKNRQEPDNK